MMLGFVLLFPAIYAIMGEIQACDHCGLDDNPDLRRFLKGEDEVGRYVNLTVTFTPGRKPEIVVLDDTAPCVDVAGYTDRAGWSCWWWQGYDCTQIDENYVRRYSLNYHDEEEIQRNCRVACNMCHTHFPQTKKLSLENRSLAQLHELVQNLGFPMKDIDSEKREEL
eukprot:GEMP01055281.1.p1 GENE.GEMP01055281.1~~GEMP01055281.1.p1  ORF type:complete len:167 (+),score=35.85 GEMP01055281.1:94-594(+)